MELDVKDIVALMEALKKNNIGKLELKCGGQELVLKSRDAQVVAVQEVVPAPASAAAAQAAAMDGEAEPGLPGAVVTSPIVGTFYAAPAPDREPFVSVGKSVKKGDVLFIIESMKLMNEVVSDHDGTVTRILAENAQPVEYGQPILCIE